jgi:hypothetical protein
MATGLFQRWFALERATGRTVDAILTDLNATCGTKYDRTWPNVVAARNFGLERCPTNVRRFMLHKVLPVELQGLGLELSKKQIAVLVVNLT